MAARIRSLNDNDLLLYDERTGAILGIRTSAADAPVSMFAGTPITINGTPQVGYVLAVAIAAGWQNQGGGWTRNGVPIEGATGVEYELQEADYDTDVTYVSTNLSAFFIPPAVHITRPPPPVVEPGLTPAVILAAPASRTVNPGEEFTLVFVATNAVQLGWQVASRTGDFADIVGVYTSDYTAGPLEISHHGRRYRGFAVGPDGVRRYTEEAVISVAGAVTEPEIIVGHLGMDAGDIYLNDDALLLDGGKLQVKPDGQAAREINTTERDDIRTSLGA